MIVAVVRAFMLCWRGISHTNRRWTMMGNGHAGYHLVSLLIAAVVIMSCVAYGQTPALIVDGEVQNRLRLSLEDLRAMRRVSSEVDDLGQRATYEGVPLTEILRRAGVPIGRAPLRGNALTSMVFVTGVDGFYAVFALAELDPTRTDQRVLLADRRDGRVLPDSEGPLRVVSPADKYPARWVRQVVRLTVAVTTLPKSPN
jgi:DMSO/TMAO reductase YedYZ molybdopterin-dependent catalytic subunit